MEGERDRLRHVGDGGLDGIGRRGNRWSRCSTPSTWVAIFSIRRGRMARDSSEQIAGGKNNRASIRTRHLYAASKIPPKNRRWPGRREFSAGRLFSAGVHRGVCTRRAWKMWASQTMDLMQFHTWEDHWLNDDRLLKAIEKMRKSGEVLAVGISLNRWEPLNGVRAVQIGADRCGAGDLQHFRPESRR